MAYLLHTLHPMNVGKLEVLETIIKGLYYNI